MLRQVFTMWLSLFRQLLSSSSTAGPSPRSHLLSEGERCNVLVMRASRPCAAESLPLCYLYFLHNLKCLFRNNNFEVGKKKDAGVTELHSVMADLRSKPIREEQDDFHGKNAGKILRFPQKRLEGFTAAAPLIRCIRGKTLRGYFLNLYLLCHLKPEPKSAAYRTAAGGD